jgi:hypothetical protein
VLKPKNKANIIVKNPRSRHITLVFTLSIKKQQKKHLGHSLYFTFSSTEGKHSFITGKKLESSGTADDVDSYKKIQKGGEIPIKGLQKPAPEKSPSKLRFHGHYGTLKNHLHPTPTLHSFPVAFFFFTFQLVICLNTL